MIPSMPNLNELHNAFNESTIVYAAFMSLVLEGAKFVELTIVDPLCYIPIDFDSDG